MKILITGVNGALGYSLKSLLNSREHEYSISTPRSSELNLEKQDEVRDYFYFNKFDYVVHLAARSGSARYSSKIPAEMLNGNLRMALNILEASALTKVRHVVMASSTAAYPVNRESPATETNFHFGPPSEIDFAYAHAKRIMEPLSRAYSKQYDLNVTTVVINGIFGPYMNFQQEKSVMLAGLIKRFHENSVKKSGFYDVYGNPNAIREYSFSDDLARAIFWILEHETDIRLINIGNTIRRTVKQYAEEVAKCLAIDIKLIRFPDEGLENTNTYNQMTNNDLFLKLSNFEYSDFRESLNKTIDWYKDNFAKLSL